MRDRATVLLEDCGPHGNYLEKTTPIRVTQKSVVAGPKASTDNYVFEDCDFDESRVDGWSFSDCVFQSCRFMNVDVHCASFWNCRFENCTFRNGSWIHVALRETTLNDCIFDRVDFETGSAVGCTIENVNWNQGGIMYFYFDYCVLSNVHFSEAVVYSVFVDCNICAGAFDHIVSSDSRVTLVTTEAGEASTRTHEPVLRDKKPAHTASPEEFTPPAVTVFGKVKGQDPLEDYLVVGRPTIEQLARLDRLMETETKELVFQKFLEANPELLTVGVELGHHGLYVLSEVPFGKKHRADFMIGAKNSMGHFWTGLEIESPSHKVTKVNGHFTQKVQHAIDQVAEWRTFVRQHRTAIQRPKAYSGEGLIGIEPDFKAWIIIGRDPKHLTADERRAKFLDANRNIHVQTWDGFRERIAAAVGLH